MDYPSSARWASSSSVVAGVREEKILRRLSFKKLMIPATVPLTLLLPAPVYSDPLESTSNVASWRNASVVEELRIGSFEGPVAASTIVMKKLIPWMTPAVTTSRSAEDSLKCGSFQCR